jgi:hypothetical protein
MILSLWWLGQMLMVPRVAIGSLAIWRLRRTSSPLPPGLEERAKGLAKKFGFRRQPMVGCSDSIQDATAFGLIRQTVLLPLAWATEMPPDIIEAILAHEFSHLRRRDGLTVAVQRLLETLFFFHPAVWWLSGQLSRVREDCCDDQAVNVIGNRHLFAMALEQAARQRAGMPLAFASRFGENRMLLLQRVKRVLDDRSPKRPQVSWLLTVVAASVPLLLATGTVLPELHAASPPGVSQSTLRSPRAPGSSPTDQNVVGEAEPRKQPGAGDETGRPDESNTEQREPFSRRSLKRSDKGDVYRLAEGDVIAVYVDGVLPAPGGVPPLNFPIPPVIKLSVGYPIPVGEYGRIALPQAGDVNVNGKSLDEAIVAIRAAYGNILRPDTRVLVTLARPRRTNIIVIRADRTEETDAVLVELPEVDADVLMARGRSVRFPGALATETSRVAKSEVYAQTYSVADLVRPDKPPGAQTTANFDPLIDLITETVLPSSWDDVGGDAYVQAFPPNLSLVVCQTKVGHEQVALLLSVLRRLRKTEKSNVE